MGQLLRSVSRTELIDIIREEMLGLPKRPSGAKQQAKPSAARRKKT